MNAKYKACGVFKKLYIPKYKINDERRTMFLYSLELLNCLLNRNKPIENIIEKNIGIMKGVTYGLIPDTNEIVAPKIGPDG